MHARLTLLVIVTVVGFGLSDVLSSRTVSMDRSKLSVEFGQIWQISMAQRRRNWVYHKQHHTPL